MPQELKLDVEEVKFGRKKYKRDRNGRLTTKWEWKHYTVASTATKDLLKYYNSPTMKRKRRVIKLELEKRNAL